MYYWVPSWFLAILSWPLPRSAAGAAAERPVFTRKGRGVRIHGGVELLLGNFRHIELEGIEARRVAERHKHLRLQWRLYFERL